MARIDLKNDESQPGGSAEQVEVSLGTRLRDGFKAGSMFWILALVCLPIPLLHFILVPLNLVLGTLRAWSHWTSPMVLVNGQATCSRCRQPLPFERMPEKWPIKILCPSCGAQARFYKA